MIGKAEPDRDQSRRRLGRSDSSQLTDQDRNEKEASWVTHST
jgi:hypothetical protein